MVRYFEDAEVGEVTDRGSYTVTAEEIVAFAERYDPQPFHVDEEAARGSIFGGIVASGWHTAALTMRLKVDAIEDEAYAGARGVDELRWHRPLRPGDTVTAEVEILAKRPSESRPEVGHVTAETRGYVDGELLISWRDLSLMYRRPDEGGEHGRPGEDA